MKKSNNIYYERFTEFVEPNSLVKVSNGKGLLFDANHRVSTVKKEDLSNDYVQCTSGDTVGYVCTSGVRSMSISKINDDLDDTKLYISYLGCYVGPLNYDVVILGKSILPVLAGVKANSDCKDTDEIINDIMNALCYEDESRDYLNVWKEIYDYIPDTDCEFVIMTNEYVKEVKRRLESVSKYIKEISQYDHEFPLMVIEALSDDEYNDPVTENTYYDYEGNERLKWIYKLPPMKIEVLD